MKFLSAAAQNAMRISTDMLCGPIYHRLTIISVQLNPRLIAIKIRNWFIFLRAIPFIELERG